MTQSLACKCCNSITINASHWDIIVSIILYIWYWHWYPSKIIQVNQKKNSLVHSPYLWYFISIWAQEYATIWLSDNMSLTLCPFVSHSDDDCCDSVEGCQFVFRFSPHSYHNWHLDINCHVNCHLLISVFLQFMSSLPHISNVCFDFYCF